MPVYVVRNGGHDLYAAVPLRKARKLTPPPNFLTSKIDNKTMELRSIIFSLIVFFVSSVKGEIRCFCNQGSCVSTGYMCKSTAFCFSDIVNGVHGCLERRRCMGIMCCKEDMCNYLEAKMQTFNPMKGSFGKEVSEESVAVMEGVLQREVWLKAAVIAVPVCGIFILGVLAVIAARMLREDADRQRRLLELRRIYGNSLRDTLLPWSKEKSTTIV